LGRKEWPEVGHDGVDLVTVGARQRAGFDGFDHPADGLVEAVHAKEEVGDPWLEAQNAVRRSRAGKTGIVEPDEAKANERRPGQE
jgi:hypothetical protein